MSLADKKILVTGSNGFIGKNLLVRLSELGCRKITTFNRSDKIEYLVSMLRDCDVIFHLAGENRPADPKDFNRVNVGLTRKICEIIKNYASDGPPAISFIHLSSSQYNLDNEYGRSKMAGEQLVENLALETGISATIFRLPGVFGKWAKPNYNSVVSTFCYNVANGIPLEIHDPKKKISLVYIDDTIDALLDSAINNVGGVKLGKIKNVYSLSVGLLANKILSLSSIRQNLTVPKVGTDIDRALYSTYLSYIPSESFKYPVTSHDDTRGSFVEIIKTQDSGQFSFFTAHPGVCRGGHYHHTKNEKFVVVKGRAKFRFRNIITEEQIEFETSSELIEVVDTIPGWAHDITNIGNEPLIVMLWANEVYDKTKPDTYYSKL
jgi:UDP-2-acetamido-2,6-beta-L-arabino-hexul-4-ose reductase